MYHYVNAITDTKGNALIGYFVKLVDISSGDVVAIYADKNGTEIETVSGIENACKINADGNASLFVEDGEYHLDIYATDGTTFVRRIENIPMANTGFLQASSRGVLATLDTTFPAMLTETGLEGIFTFRSSDLSAEVESDPDQYTYVAPTSDDTGESGAWVRVGGEILSTDTSSGVISGLGVVYSGTGLVFAMSAGTYRIDGQTYVAAAQTITLSAADATNPRIDALYVDTTGTLGKIDGTPATNPSQPAVDPNSQLYLTFVLVPATATTLSGVTTEDIYLENTEWTTSLLGTGFNPASTTNPYAGTKCIETTGTIESPDYVKFTRATPMSFDGDGNLMFRIRSKATWNTKRSLTIQWALNSVDKGQPVAFKSGTFGFDSSQTSSYQLVVISKSLFSVSAGTTVNELRITENGTSGPPTGLYLDNIQLQNSGTVFGGGVPGLTTEQADARYLKLTGGTLSGDLVVPAEVYGVSWNGSNEVPTKNDVYDKIQTVIAGSGVSDGDKGDITVSGSGSVFTIDNGVVTLAKIANASANSKLVGSGSAGSGAAYSEITLGTGLTMTGTTLSASGTSGAAWNLQWSPMVAEFPASNFATMDSRNNHPCLDFDTTTQETVYFTGVLPADYSGAGVTVHLYCSLTSATTGTVGWDVAFERMDASSLNIGGDSFGSATTVTAVTVPGTSGQLLKMSVNVSNGTNMDSLAAGEAFRLRVRRDVANDTATGDAELLRVMMVSQ